MLHTSGVLLTIALFISILAYALWPVLLPGRRDFNRTLTDYSDEALDFCGPEADTGYINAVKDVMQAFGGMIPELSSEMIVYHFYKGEYRPIRMTVKQRIEVWAYMDKREKDLAVAEVKLNQQMIVQDQFGNEYRTNKPGNSKVFKERLKEERVVLNGNQALPSRIKKRK